MPKTEKSAKIWRMVSFSSGLQIPLPPLQRGNLPDECTRCLFVALRVPLLRGAGGIQNTRLFNYNLLCPHILSIDEAQYIHARFIV